MTPTPPLLVAVMTLTFGAITAPAQAPANQNWDNRFGHSDFFNTHLATATTSDGRLFVGGSFQTLAQWDGRVWTRFNSAQTNGLGGDVWAMQADGTNVYIGGSFIAANAGQTLNRITLRSNGVFRALGSGLNGTVYAIAVRSNEVFVGGSFTTAGGSPATNVARWNGTSWSALGPGAGATVRALTFGPDGSLYAGGTFTTAGGATIRGLARWNGSAWAAVGTGVNGDVLALWPSGSDVFAGGNFTTAGGTPVNRIARWNGTSWSALGSGANNEVRSLYEWNGQIYAGGVFTTMGGVPATGIARWNGSSWAALNGGVSGDSQDVRALGVFQGNLVAAGAFLFAGDKSVNRIAQWDGTDWSAMHLSISEDVNAIARHDTNVFIGGVFVYAGGKKVNSVVRWDGQKWSQPGPGTNSGFNSVVRALSVTTNGTLYAGGSFTQAGTNPVSRIARFDGANWQSLGSGLNNAVHAIAVLGTNLYAAGVFDMAGAVPTRGIARWNGSAWSGVGGSFDLYSYVYALAVIGNDLYAGGIFTGVGGVAATNIARWDGTRWWPVGGGITSLSFPQVNAFAVRGTDLYAGGLFTRAGTVTANNVAKWNGQSWSALGAGVDREVKALAFDGDVLYVGGLITTAGAGAANYIAKFENNAWSLLGSGTWENNRYVYALSAQGTNVFVGGGFREAGGKSSPYFAIWHPQRIAPSVSLTEPGANQEFIAGSSVVVSAIAQSGTGSIARVEFFRDGQLAGSVTNPPYTIAFSNLLAGNYLIVAEAIDHVGSRATTPAVPIRVKAPPANLPPTVSITSPPSNSIFSVGQTIPLTAEANDPDGFVRQVAFYEGDNLLGIATNFPFTVNWTNAMRMTYDVRAVAMDNWGVETTSAPVPIRVQQPPDVSIVSPSEDAHFTGPLNITLTADARDLDGSVTNVLFYINGVLLGRYVSFSSPNYSLTWSNVTFASYAITARAFDDLGGVTTSAAVNITVDSPNVLPAVSITSPVAGQTFTAPTNMVISVAASDSDGFVQAVRFYEASGLLGTVTSAPFDFVWSNLTAGAACLRAVAVDNRGGTKTSAQVCIDVQLDPMRTPRFALIDLGELTGNESRAYGINASGQVVGGAWTPVNSSTYPFIYTDGALQFLDSQPLNTGYGLGINDAGNIAGYVGSEAFLYAGGTLTKLGSLGGPSGTSGARAVNTTRQVVGWTTISGGNRRAFLYESNQMLNLGTIGVESEAAGINDAGFVVGWSGTASFIYDRTNGMRALTALNGSSSQARAINRDGAIAGFRTSPDNYQRAFLLTGTNAENLGTLGGYNSFGMAINNSNHIVGYAENHTFDSTAFLWRDHIMYELGQLLYTTNSNWVLREAFGVNDAGQIVGWGYKDFSGSARARAFLLTPLPRADESNRPPVVTLTTPTNNAGFFASEDVVLQATAFDPDGEVARVDFYEGVNRLGTATNRPYRVTWPNVPAGDYALTARATDLLGATQVSAAANISVVSLDSNAPAVAVFGASPAANNNDVQTKIRDTRRFRRVDLFDATTATPTLAQLQQYKAVFVYSSSPFQSSVGLGNVLADYVDAGGGVVMAAFSYSPSSSSIEGRFATDGYLPWAKSASFSGTALTLVPNVPAQHPIIEGVTSFNGGPESYHHRCNFVIGGSTLVASWNNGQPLAATRELNGGRIAGLNFFPPSSDVAAGNWNAGTDGTRLMANALVWAAAVPNRITVAITNPPPKATFYPGQFITLSAQASTSTGAIQRVEYYDGTNQIGSSLTAPFNVAWANASVGNHFLTAVAFDFAAKHGVSRTVPIVVESRITVTLTNPANGTVFYTPTNVAFGAHVTDLDASIVKVEFFAGSDKMGQATAPPYTAVWQNAGAGMYALTARATDSLGVVKTSAPVSITVIDPNNPVDNHWLAGTANWFAPDSWSIRVPFPQDTAIINNGGSAQIGGGLARARYLQLGVSGIGNLSLTGGTLSVANEVLLGADIGSSGELSLSGSGQLLTASMGLAGSGRVIQTGGINRSTDLWIASGLTAQGEYELAGGELFSFGQSLGHGSDGWFLQTGGTNAIESYLLLGTGNRNGTGTYDLRGGRVTAPLQKVGYEGKGRFRQSGGENLVSSELIIGDFNEGEYAITNGLLAARDLIVGHSAGTLRIQSTQAQVIVSNRLVFDRSGDFRGVPGSSVLLLGDRFDVLHDHAERFTAISNLTLVVGGTNLARLEAAGVSVRGFESNIVLGALNLGAANPVRAQLIDVRDNDQSGFFGDEAFFTHALNWQAGSALDLNGLPLIVSSPVQVRGELTLSDGSLVAPAVSVMSNGVLRTGGAIDADLLHSGRIASGDESRALQIEGTFEQLAAGSFEVNISGVSETEYDHIVVSGAAHLGGKLTVRLTDGFMPARSIFPIVKAAQVIGTFAVEDLPPETNGVTWQLRYEAGGVYLESSLAPQLTVVAPITFNAQSGLFEQRVQIDNTGMVTVAAVRVLIHDLPPGVTVQNASGYDGSTPYVDYNSPLPPGGSVLLVIEYSAPQGTTFTPRLELVLTVPEPQPDPMGTPLNIDSVVELSGGSYLIGLRTLTNRTYYIQYSSDLLRWKTARPPLVGTGGNLQWIDNGPPKTDALPGTRSSRFYRMLLMPE